MMFTKTDTLFCLIPPLRIIMYWAEFVGLAHELGHVVLNHLPYIAEPLIAEHNFNNLSNPELEAEADYFAAAFLCPMPLFDILGVKSAKDIEITFGLSHEASECRWNDYVKWKRNHRKTAWENDLKRIYQLKQ